MAITINFPSDPTVGQQYTYAGRTWQWDGTVWLSLSAPGIQGIQGTQGIGNVGSQGVQGMLGIQGSEGYVGSDGSQGVQGTQGLSGPAGLSGTPVTTYEENFISTLGQTRFTLLHTPVAAWVWLEGLAQDASTWSISNNDIVLSEGTENGESVKIYYMSSANVTPLIGPQGAIGPQGPQGVQGPAGEGGGGIEIINIIYDDLVTSINSNLLVPAQSYRITDYSTTHYILDGDGDICYDGESIPYINVGGVEPLIVTATSINSLSPIAHSESYPQDILYYDWNPNNWLLDVAISSYDEVVLPGFKGVIYYREDTKNQNILGYDFRSVKNRRWKFNYPIWDEVTTFDSGYGELCQVPGDGIYKSIKDDNINHLVSDYSWWSKLVDYSLVGEYWCSNINDAQDEMDYIDLLTFVEGSGRATYDIQVKFNRFNPSKSTTEDISWSAYSHISNNVFYINTLDKNWAGILEDNGYCNIISNNLGYSFSNNTIEGLNFEGNDIGNYCFQNIIGSGFMNNNISNEFRYNFIGFNFQGNSIGNSFYENYISAGFFYNQVGDEFYDNIISHKPGSGSAFKGSARYNNISPHFSHNVIQYSFDYNVIGSLFNSNIIGNGFSGNTVGSEFEVNTIGEFAYYNQIGNGFLENTIEIDFDYNTIGNGFYSNTIGINFNFNTIGNDFCSNITGINFYYNTISSYFQSNTIGDYFYSNTIGNYFYSNTIGNYFKSNTIQNNIMYVKTPDKTSGAASFHNNIIKDGVSGDGINTKLDFTGATHVFADYNCEIFKTSTGTIKLRYVDGATNLDTIVNHNA